MHYEKRRKRGGWVGGDLGALRLHLVPGPGDIHHYWPGRGPGGRPTCENPTTIAPAPPPARPVVVSISRARRIVRRVRGIG